MKPVNKLNISFDVSALKEFLVDCDLWDKYPQRRTAENSPHSEMKDIWVRYKNPEECIKTGDWSAFTKEHESEWLENIPNVKTIAYRMVEFVNGEKLGGVLITKLPPGARIQPHTDAGWHAEYYDKYFISIKNENGSRFHFDDCHIDPKEGEVYAFRNDKNHWVENDSSEDRIAMIICIKQNKFSKEGLCLGQQQQQ
tara:strand:- start:48 stop:638 length:591 start_codon:yes stop_codon:yes gene_type:complete